MSTTRRGWPSGRGCRSSWWFCLSTSSATGFATRWIRGIRSSRVWGAAEAGAPLRLLVFRRLRGAPAPAAYASFGRNHDQSIRSRFGAPRFAGTARHLAHVRLVLVGGEAVELLGDGIEANERVGGPVGEPHLVLVVDVHRVRVRDAGQLPF